VVNLEIGNFQEVLVALTSSHFRDLGRRRKGDWNTLKT